MQKNHRRRLGAVAAASTMIAGVALASPALAASGAGESGRTVLVTDGLRAGSGDLYDSGAVSANGRYVVFASAVGSLAANDTNGTNDVFVRDLRTDTNRLVSVGLNGSAAGSDSSTPSISADGRYVAFGSSSADLVKTATSAFPDVFVRDLTTNVTRLVTTRPDGSAANGGGYAPSISGDGSRVAFVSGSSDLISGDTNNANDIFVWDRKTGTSIRASVGPGGVQSRPTTYEEDPYGAGYPAVSPQISGNGQVVVFGSNATNLVQSDTNGSTDIFAHDLRSHQTTRVSVATGGGESDHGYKGIGGENPSISANGDVVVFESYAGGLVSPEPFHQRNSYVHFVGANRTALLADTTGNGSGTPGTLDPSVSPDGRYVAFSQDDPQLVPGDTDTEADVFVKDLKKNTIKQVSVDLSNAAAVHDNDRPSISAGGKVVVFLSTEHSSYPNGLLLDLGSIYARRPGR